MDQIILFLIVLIIIIAIIVNCICIVPQANAWVIETLGKYDGTWNAGLHFKIPFISRVAS